MNMNKFFKKLSDFYKRYLERRRRREEEAQTAELERLFGVRERCGRLYIMAGDVAVSKVGDNVTAKEITEVIVTMRGAYRDYLR